MLHTGESLPARVRKGEDGGLGNSDFNHLSVNAAVGDLRGEGDMTWGEMAYYSVYKPI